MQGGRYLQQRNINYQTTVTLGSSYTNTAGSPLNPVIPLVFTTKGTGIFSFYIAIPVYILTANTSTNSDMLSPINWKIRTGIGSELYSLADGVSNGGCLLMGIGMSASDWLDIEWEWIN